MSLVYIKPFSLLWALLVGGGAASWEGSGRALATLDSISLAGENKIIATTGAAGDQFGGAVCKLGNYTVVGHPLDDSGGPLSDGGSAVIYSTSDGGSTWTFLVQLFPSGISQVEAFGSAVSISKDSIAIGAPLDNSVDIDGGVVYMYYFSRGGWSEIQIILPDGANKDMHFGGSVAISQQHLVVGATGSDIAGVASGSVYMYYTPDGGISWSPTSRVFASNGGPHQLFGSSVAAAGDMILIGAEGGNTAIVSNAGLVYSFIFSATQEFLWSEVQIIAASDPATYDQFGNSVAVFNDRLIVGARNATTLAGERSGAAYVYFFFATGQGSSWSQLWKLVADDGQADDEFGSSVSIAENVAVVGAEKSDTSDSGAVYLYASFDSYTWSEHFKVVPSDGVTDGYFGAAVSVEGENAVIGAPGDDMLGAGAGAAYLFTVVTTIGDPLDKVVASNGLQGDVFGSALSSSPGPFILTGAPAIGVGQGSAYLYRSFDGGNSWSEISTFIASDAQNGDEYGAAVAMDYEIFAVGAPKDIAGQAETGSVYTYLSADLMIWSEIQKLLAADGVSGDEFGCAVATQDFTLAVGAEGVNFPATGISNGGSVYIFKSFDDGSSWTELQKLFPGDLISNAFFGHTISLYGSALVVGAPGDDDNGVESGSVYVYRSADGGITWFLNQKVVASDGVPMDRFGTSVSYFDTSFVVGSLSKSGIGTSTGSAYIFDSTDGGDTFFETAILIASDASNEASFGSSVFLGNKVLIVGAPGDDAMGEASGSLYVFKNPGGAFIWSETSKLIAADGTVEDRLGVAVTLVDGTAFAGSFQDDDRGLTSGSAYFFRIDIDVPIVEAENKLLASDGGPGDNFGSVVSVDFDTIVTGSPHDADAGKDSGSVYVSKTYDGGLTWVELQKCVASDAASGDLFGHSVSLYSNVFVVGAPLDGDGSSIGSVYVFDTVDQLTWSEQLKVVAADSSPNDFFGVSVSLYKDHFVVGAYGDIEFTGSVYVFWKTPSSWSQIQKLQALGGSLDDRFGFSVALYADTIIIGADGDDSEYNNGGAVYIFNSTDNGFTWLERQKIIPHSGESNSLFGISVSLFGNKAVIGAPAYHLAGAAFLYCANSDSKWIFAETLLATDLEGGGQYGNGVYIHRNIIAVSAPEDYEQGVSSGSVYVLRSIDDGDTWTDENKVIPYDGSDNDKFGKSISVSDNFIIVGSSGDDDLGPDSGSVYVYDIAGITPTGVPSSQPSVLPSGNPSADPTTMPSGYPTTHPSALPTGWPTGIPSAEPSNEPTGNPTGAPTGLPSGYPTSLPTTQPSAVPSSCPSVLPTRQPSRNPTAMPSVVPTERPSVCPSSCPSGLPSGQPSSYPTVIPTSQPSQTPTATPSGVPSVGPTGQPSVCPSSCPSSLPSGEPSSFPSGQPTGQPTDQPTQSPTTTPSGVPSVGPTGQPSICPSSCPSSLPSGEPSSFPNGIPTGSPTIVPSGVPTPGPSGAPTEEPSVQPTQCPTSDPSATPSGWPSMKPSVCPTACPTTLPSTAPSLSPSGMPSGMPSGCPTCIPSSFPTGTPSTLPSASPTATPTAPTTQPTNVPTRNPGSPPTSLPSSWPSQPTSLPSTQPTLFPTAEPSRDPTEQPSGPPSRRPSQLPTGHPTAMPSGLPMSAPIASPTTLPTSYPSTRPTTYPTLRHTGFPSVAPTCHPSYGPTARPSGQPTTVPTVIPSGTPTCKPSSQPSNLPSAKPSILLSNLPSASPRSSPSSMPSKFPTYCPSSFPTSCPSGLLTAAPSGASAILPAVPSPPNISDATLTPDGLIIRINFDSSTDLGRTKEPLYSQYFVCSSLVWFQGADEANCLWLSPSSLRAHLYAVSDDASARKLTKTETVLSSGIRVQASSILAACPAGALFDCSRRRYSSVLQGIAVTPPVNPDHPIVSLSASSLFLSCEPILLDPTSSSGNAGTNWAEIIWTVEGTGNTTDLLEFLTTAHSTHTNEIIVVSNNLTAKAGTFSVTLTLVNIFELSSNATVSIAANDNSIRPDTGIFGNRDRLIFRDQELHVTANASIPSCFSYLNGSLQYVWEVTELFGDSIVAKLVNSTSNDPRRLVLAPYALQSSRNYIVKVTSFIGSNEYNSSYSIRVRVSKRVGIEVILTGGDVRTVSGGASWSLDASNSYHVDDPTYPLTFEWACVEVSPVAGATCGVNFLKNRAVVEFEYLNTSVYERVWEFAVSVSSSLDYFIGTASNRIIVDTADVPVISFSDIPRKINPQGEFIISSYISVYSLFPVYANWSVIEADEDVASVATTPVYRIFDSGDDMLFSLGVGPNFFVEGRTYTLQLSLSTVFDKSTVWINQLYVDINRAPYGGIIDVSPNTGRAFTVFLLQSHSWKVDPENYPLTYGFSYYVNDPDERHELLADGDVTRVNAVLGSGTADADFNVICISLVTDIFGSFGEATESVEVNPLVDLDLVIDIVNELLNEASRRLDTDRLFQVTSATVLALDAKNCSEAPNCVLLNRKSCRSAPHTCSECLPGFIGPDFSNSACIDSDLLSEPSCESDDTCPVGQLCIDNTCRFAQLTCASDCSGRGACVSVNTLDNIIPACYVGDVYCSVRCDCDEFSFGQFCEYSQEEFALVQDLRERLCVENVGAHTVSDLTLASSISRAVSVGFLLQDITQLTDSALDSCTDIIVNSIAENRQLSAIESAFSWWLGAISNALAVSSVDRGGPDRVRRRLQGIEREVVAKMTLSTEQLGLGAQSNLPTGSFFEDVAKNVRVFVALLYPDDADDEIFRLPRSDIEVALGGDTVDVHIDQSIGNEVSEFGVTLSQFTNNPYGLSFNSTPVNFETSMYSTVRGSRSTLSALSHRRNVTVTLQNISPVPYNFRNTSTTEHKCFVNEIDGSFVQYVIDTSCGDKMVSVTCPGNVSGIVEAVCSPAHDEPICITNENGQYGPDRNCSVLEFDSESTTCLCEEEVDTTRQSDTFSRIYTSTVYVIGTSFASRFETANSLSLATLRDNFVIVSVMSVIVFFLIFGALWFLYVDYAFILQDDEKRKGKKYIVDKVTPETLKQLVIPLQFMRRKWHRRYWAILKAEWSILAFIYTRKGRAFRYYALSWLYVIGKLINFVFVGTLIAVFFFSDDTECAEYGAEIKCEERLGVDYVHSLCVWEQAEQQCVYNEYQTSVQTTLISTMIINFFVSPIDAMLKHFLLIIQFKMINQNKERRKSVAAAKLLTDTNQIVAVTGPQVNKDVQKNFRLRNLVTLAVRFEKMRIAMDNVDAMTELFVMLELRRLKEKEMEEADIERQREFSRWRHDVLSLINDVPLLRLDDKPTLTYKLRRLLTFSAFGIEEILRNKPTYMMRKASTELTIRNVVKYGKERYMLGLLNRSRGLQAEAGIILDEAEDDDEREVYLMKLFFVESMVGYRRTICERFFFQDSLFGMRSKLYRSSSYQLFCSIAVPVYLLFFSFYVLLFGISVGQETTKVWLATIIISFLEDLLLVEPVVCLFYSIFVASIVYKDVVVLSTRIFSRQRAIVTRVRGQLDPIVSYVQHFNPACRLSREYPALYASRLLMSLNDWDIPVSYLARYNRHGVRTGIWRFLAILNATLVLVFLTVLPSVVQEGLMEAATSLFFNGTFLWMYSILDFTGFGLIVAIFGILIILVVIFALSQARQGVKKKHAHSKRMKKIRRHSAGSSVSDSESELSYVDIYPDNISVESQTSAVFAENDMRKRSSSNFSVHGGEGVSGAELLSSDHDDVASIKDNSNAEVVLGKTARQISKKELVIFDAQDTVEI